VQRRLVSKLKMHKNIPMHIQELNYGECVYELDLNLLLSLDLQKNSFNKFFELPTKKCLSRIFVSLCLVAPPQRGKT
jgi:hypothetical protein